MEFFYPNPDQKFSFLPNVRNATVKQQHSDGPFLYRQKNEENFGDIDSSIHLQMLSLTPSPDLSRGISYFGSSGRRPSERCVLPNRKTDHKQSLTLSDILQNGLLLTFAKEKAGSQQLQALYPTATSGERRTVAKRVIANPEVFIDLACNMFGNFFLQKVIEYSTSIEQYYVASHLRNNIFQLCLDRYANRVVQNAFDVLSEELKLDLASELAQTDLVRLCIDQNANHVIQKIMTKLTVRDWAFIINTFVSDETNLFQVIENKYGCRIVQLAVERLVDDMESHKDDSLLKNLMNLLIKNCRRFTLNEFSNYVIQYVISCNSLEEYRDIIIKHCLLGNMLSMAQDKHASHVIEKALRHASPMLVCDMMEEIFDGYLPHPETGMDALDIILFHQFGNYIIQQILAKCIEAARILSSGETAADLYVRLNWLRRLSAKISSNKAKLAQFSSGKKIIDMLGEVNPILFIQD